MSSTVLATIVGAVATILAGFGGAALGGWIVWRSQTRAFRERERSIAAALLEDMRRIEAGVPRLDVNQFTRQFAGERYPTLHAWVQPLIVQLASRDASIVGGCMRLEKLLEQHQHARQVAWEAQGSVVEERGNIERIQEGLNNPDMQPTHESLAASLLRVRDRLAAREDGLANAVAAWEASDHEVTRVMQSLRTSLERIVSLPPQSRPFPRRTATRLTSEQERTNGDD